MITKSVTNTSTSSTVSSTALTPHLPHDRRYVASRARRGRAGQLEQPLQLLGRGGVAAQVVVDLAGAVVVARPGDDEPEVAGDRAQRVAVGGRRGPGGRPRSRPARPRRRSASVDSSSERALVPAPRVRHDADPAGGGDDAEQSGQRRGVAVDVRRAPGGAGTARRPRRGRPRPRARPARRPRGGGRSRSRRRRRAVRRPRRPRCRAPAAGPASPAPGRRGPSRIRVQLLDQRRVRRVGQVGEQVHAATGVPAAELHARDQRDADLGGSGGRPRPSPAAVSWSVSATTSSPRPRPRAPARPGSACRRWRASGCGGRCARSKARDPGAGGPPRATR